MGEHRGLACAWPAQGRALVAQGDFLPSENGVLVGGWDTDFGLDVKLCRSFTGTPVPGAR